MSKILHLMLEMSDATRQIKQASDHLIQVLNHLFKIKYALNSYYLIKWRKDINKNLKQAKRESSHKNSVLSSLRKPKEIESIYLNAKKAYKNDYRTEDKFMRNIRDIPFPSKCPWTVDELFNNSIDELLKKLPDLK